jgi:hypothetical protein
MDSSFEQALVEVWRRARSLTPIAHQAVLPQLELEKVFCR